MPERGAARETSLQALKGKMMLFRRFRRNARFSSALRGRPAQPGTLQVLASSLMAVLILGGCHFDGPASDGKLPDDQKKPIPYDQRGRELVGFRTVNWQPAGKDTPLVIKIWYPADTTREDESIEYPLTFKYSEWQDFDDAIVKGRAALDAPVNNKTGPFPVIIFSHGYSLSPEFYSSLLEQAASHGFVILAPEHAESDWLQAATTLRRRPEALRATIDFAEQAQRDRPELGRAMDLEHIGVAGHSFGGYAALASAGARIHLADFQDFCAKLDEEDPRAFLCAPFMGSPEEIADLAGFSDSLDSVGPPMGDSRIKAVLPISGDAYLFGEQGLKEVTLPLLAMGGTEDFGTPWELGAQMAFEFSNSKEKALVGFESGSHMLPANPCSSMPWTSQLSAYEYGIFCEDPAWEKQSAQTLMSAFTIAFFRAKLLDDQEAEQQMKALASQQDAISFETNR